MVKDCGRGRKSCNRMRQVKREKGVRFGKVVWRSSLGGVKGWNGKWNGGKRFFCSHICVYIGPLLARNKTIRTARLSTKHSLFFSPHIHARRVKDNNMKMLLVMRCGTFPKKTSLMHPSNPIYCSLQLNCASVQRHPCSGYRASNISACHLPIISCFE